ncbi:hypothetical protein REH76_24175, partial [Photobacterium damselae]
MEFQTLIISPRGFMERIQFKDEDQFIELKKLQMYFSSSSEQGDVLTNTANVNTRIGAWSFDSETQTYIRANDEDSWWWEQSRDVIHVNKSDGKRRICVIGESAAHGMFFSPSISPAKACEQILNLESKGNDEFGVIDLTRICMNPSQLLATIESCKQ